ncbi:MAG TPA: hypothetical protein ENG44_00730 [Desulfurococcaceae archaeon]|nr:hypothetical protein [Desulfurococcaceae archaeon]
MHTSTEYFYELKSVKIHELEPNLKNEVVDLVNGRAELDKIIVYEYEHIPMRLQELFNELRKKGLMTLGTIVYRGKLYVICISRR